MLIPITAMAMPLYVMIDGIGLNGTLLGLILASSFFPFGAFLSYLYFTSVLPPDLVNMGRIDGLGDFGIYRYLGIPLSKSLISVVTFFCFVSLWSSYHLPNILLADPSKSLLSIGIEAFYGQETALVAILMVAPSVLLFLAANKTIARGIFSGAVKE
jgi:multiple sugar transport system permease protein